MCLLKFNFEIIIGSTIGMAIVTGPAGVDVVLYFAVIIIYLRLVTVFVTENTFENCVICWIYMAFITGCPLLVVSSGIDWKILGIMIPCGLSPIVCIMTIFTGCRKLSS